MCFHKNDFLKTAFRSPLNDVSLTTKKGYIQNGETYSCISLFWSEISFTVSRGWRLERITCWKRLLLAKKEKQRRETMTEQ